MKVTCPGCNATFKNIPESKKGKTAVCKKCGADFKLQPDDEEIIKPGKTTKFKTAMLEKPPLETVMERPPLETVTENAPLETIMENAPLETIMENAPLETIMENAPLETIMENAPLETIMENAPLETVMDGPAETIMDGPAETVMEDAPGKSLGQTAETIMEGALLQPATLDEEIAASDVTQVSAEEAAVPADWDIDDTILDLYEVKGLLGEGGMGKVYKVFHKTWQVELAVKSPKPSELERAGGAEVFEREAETWVNLGLHPNTVSCYYVRRLGGIPRLFAELVDGGSLQDWIADGKLTGIGEILDVAIQFAWGLHYSHERGLVHQDIKPANVMLTMSGVAKVTDFGLAQARKLSTGGDKGSDTVAYGGMTPAYCSPEQANKERLTPKTDMWSWATSILEMFTGEVTWMYGVAAGAALDEYLKNGSANKNLPHMPDKVSFLLKRCFNEKVEARPKDMKDVADALIDIYQEETGSAYPRRMPKAGRDTGDSLNNRAISLLDLGRINEAERLWEEALFNEPHHPDATFNSGLVAWRRGKVTDIDLTRNMEEAVKTHGAESECDYFLGLIHLERDDCQTAIETLRDVDDSSPAKTNAQTSLEDAEQRSGQCKKLLSTFMGSQGQVTSVALSDDGRQLLAGSDDHTARLLDIETEKELHTFDHESHSVTAVALSASGKLAITGGFCSVKVWDTATGEFLQEFSGHTGWINSVSISEDESKALTSSWDSTVRLWDVATGELINTIEGCFGKACLSANGQLILAGVEDNTIRLMKADSGEQVRTFNITPGALFLSRDAKKAVVADLDDTILVINIDSGKILSRFSGHGGTVTSLALSSDERWVLSGSYDKTVRLWDTATSRCRRTFGRHEDVVCDVAFSSDGKRAVSAGWDKTVRLWSVKEENTYRAPIMVSMVQASETVLSAGAAYDAKLVEVNDAFSKGDMIAAHQSIREARNQPGFSRGAEALEAWGNLYSRLPRNSLNGGWESKTLAGHEGSVNDVAVSADGYHAITGGSDNKAILWDIKSGEALHSFEGHTNRITAVAIAEESSKALTASGDGTMRLWDTAHEGKALSVMTQKAGAILTADISSDGRFVLSGSEESEVVLWDTNSGRAVRSLKGHSGSIESVTFSFDGRYAISGSSDRTARIWELASGKCLRVLSGHITKVNAAKLFVNAKRAITGAEDGSVIVWSTGDAKTINTFDESSAPVTALDISLDGKYFLSADKNRAVRLWSIETGRNLRVFEGHTQQVNSVVFSPDGRFALSASDDKTVKVWTLDWELEKKKPAPYDESAERYLQTFLTRLLPYAGVLPEGRDPFEKEVSLALTRKGKPLVSNEAEERLLSLLGHAGFGWLEADVVKAKLNEMAQSWSGAPESIELEEDTEAGPAELAVGEKVELEEDDEESVDELKTVGFTRWVKSFGTKKR